MSASAIPYRAKHVGVCPPARGAVIGELVRAHPAPLWLIVVDEPKLAEQLAEDIAFFETAGATDSPTGNRKLKTGNSAAIYILPESMPDTRDMREAFAASADRLTVLSALRGSLNAEPKISHPKLIVTTPAALSQPVPALAQFATAEITLASGQAQPFQALIEKLRELDYDSEAVCEAPGSYAVRGGIIDVYPITATQPYRLDFFGDEIEDIRAFDPVTQRSAESVASITLSASPRVRLEPSKTGMADYLPAGTNLLLVEPAMLEENFNALSSETGVSTTPASDFTLPPSLFTLLQKVSGLFGVSDLDEASEIFDAPGTREVVWETDSLVHHRSYPSNDLVANERLQAEEDARARFLKQVAQWTTRDGYALTIITAKEGEENRAKEILAGTTAFKKIRPRYLRGTLNEGFRITRKVAQAEISAPPFQPALYITETELFGRQRARRAGGAALQQRALVQRAQVDQLLDFSELVEGDLVVHIQHGIAIYRGLAKIDHATGMREVISLEFDDGVTLHVPLQESHLVSRYVGLSKTRPQLGRIGTNRWEKTRRAAEVATIDLAAELLRIQAAREAQSGHAFGGDTTWQKEFEASFPFTETRDQLRAIDETKADMERERSMDRLICGDVGFGKTEVAIRAAFKAVQDGYQVALLVPTTVLAQQHLNTFRERMAGYPVIVEMVSRFRTRGEQNKIIAATAAGQVDILIGTHRLLQKDIVFRNLGLVVIDEEQRFGVKHKERLKTMRATVDVLSMSATPIPRTLYMALTGARDMSVIETAPTNRHPVQTIVKTYDEKLIIEAVRHELRRGGQVFYLHNRVQTIDLVAARLRELLPDLRIGVGHGQMHEKDLEHVMTDFVAGKYDILVCTTIIESGLDIPNCNTIIIEGADRFGLSQLYQLRGRVGRFKHQAYAYLLLHRHTHLVEIARQRLNALRAHNQLGAGFRIAMRDLELRGAGNLLGAEQSGHIVGVGFELYCQLLRQSVARLKGEKSAASIRANVKLDFVYVGEADEDRAASPKPPPGASTKSKPNSGERALPSQAHATSYSAIKAAEDAASGIVEIPKIQARIPSAYISETRLRIDFYRRLALAETPESLKQIQNDLRDRFGKYGDEVKALFLITEIRIRAEQKNILSVETAGTRLKCLRNTGKHDDFVMHGTRFPRLAAPKPLARLKEILVFLNNLPNA
ncbi:transcription-repair coupling factor (superfamily II helicase) [Ereboglobus sp. PH5-5]|uniref:transcription-repair coupling factor n=1 Tax=Ereboglobus sp. PH5-5 TaxID=2940529 RepID=UPI002406E197|nr:transcription-repair coupling factor [Ereboglobus sp. PH5-5]MDF9833027.1 transcription-repair coupling factor (superfamily II helicase) [Ereboglobus sp. PH5-5]